jgi:hypothetical protein
MPVALVLGVLLFVLTLPFRIVHAQVVACERAFGLNRDDAQTDEEKAALSRSWIRAMVLVIFLGALVLAIVLPRPEHVPGFFLGSTTLLRLGVFSGTFLGSLLIVTPLYRGVVLGTLPIEISPRGARYEDVAETTLRIKDRLQELEEGQEKQLATGKEVASQVDDLASAVAALLVQVDEVKHCK